MKKKLFINEDDNHFTSNHPIEDMTRDGLERLVDLYTENTQVGGVLFCVNYQKALYKSDVWEYLCDGYDPNGPDNQTFLKNVDLSTGGHGRSMFDNMLALDERKLDRYQIWIDRCRYRNTEGWLTIRMNDGHGLQELRKQMEGIGNYHGCFLVFPSTFWKDHPEYMRAPYREERSFEGTFDYAQPDVRKHYLKLIAEVLSRWDMDGIELDWLRWGVHFKPGYEAEGKAILTEFMEEVRRLVKKAEKRLGHPVKLGVRIPWELDACEALGYDPLVWGEKKIVDQVVLSSFDATANFTYPISLWRKVFGNNVRILVHCSDFLVPYSALGLKNMLGIKALHHGSAASALNREADGLYFFNTCYMENSEPDEFKNLLQTLGAEESLRKHSRRHTVNSGAAAPGLPGSERLPIPLVNPSVGYDYNRMEESITLRIDTGFKPTLTDSVFLYLGFSDSIELNQKSEVRCNGNVLNRIRDISDAGILNKKIEYSNSHIKESIPFLLAYQVSNSSLKSGENIFELISFTGNAELRWVEVLIQP